MDNVREKLGTTANMLYGYNPSWLSGEAGNNALFPVPDPALEEIEIKSLDETGYWSYPYVSLHDTPESLLDNLLPYQVKNPSNGAQAAVFPAGTLLIGDRDRDTAIQKLSETLGVNLSNSNFGYALVQLKRVDGIDTHPSNKRGMLVYPNPANIPDELGVKSQFRRTMASFKRVKSPDALFSPDDIEVSDANEYLQCFAQHGTHFISGVTLGDTIFQVYAMPRDRYEIVKERTSSWDLSGSLNTLSFEQFTTSSSGEYGYVEEYGKVLSFSQSDVLSQAVAENKWLESTFAKANSIFAAFDTSAEIDISILNSDYTDVTVVMRDLTSLTLFAEYSRNKIWTRVFKGGLIQKYKGVVQPKFVPYYKKDLSESLQQDQLEGFLSYIATPVINTYKPSLNLSDLDFVFPEEVQKFTLYGNYLYSSKSKTITIPGNDVLICGQLFPLETEDYTTTIEVNDDALQNLSFSCQKFYGALLVQNVSKTEYFTFVDGLKYINTEEGLHGRYYVQVNDDVRNPPASDKLERLKSSLRFSYSFSEAAINSLEAECSPTLCNCSDFDLKNFLIQSLVWITQIVPKDTTDVDLLDLRVGALDLIHIGQDTSLGAFVPILPVDRYQENLDGILMLIKTIDAEIKDYQEQIRGRKALELVISDLNVLNENIIESGELLADYVNANIAQIKSFSEEYSSIITEKETEKQEIEATISELDGQLFQQRAEVKTAVENYKQALQDWQRRENIKFALEVATIIFEVGTLMKTPQSLADVAKELGSLTESIQNFLNIANILNGIYETSGSASELQEAQNSFEDIGEITNLELDILNVQMSSVVSIQVMGLTKREG
ncbi:MULTISPECIES: MAC/perforin domain-containing protein [unclassified Moorena]|uniref:MAC/perforin domain-containing protein n=1 Tax=unclassified Moorena TaxID=2683338 RepID=UPI0014009D8F|nr:MULTISPECIES: MAC/perforin domain-containing protein [unclassified Moorena]NEO17233.1 hypothetical protein [Moorena sp. SIO3E8]NEQ03770.1 hypothetical protein [Moorena sp. SIO3F7]